MKTKMSAISLLSICLGFIITSCSNFSSKPTIQDEKSNNLFSFAYFTDVHINANNQGMCNEGLGQALERANQDSIDFILFGGDNADTDALGDKEATAESLHSRFKSIVDKSKIKSYFTIGNHDRFYLKNNQPDSLGFGMFEKHYGKTYYSFNHKGVHFIVLNSLYPCNEYSYSINPEQIEWLKNDLKNTGEKTPVIVSLHVPMLSLYYPVVEGNFKGLDMIYNTKEVLDILNQYNLKLVLQGHQHIYEQIQERNRWFVTAGAVSAYWWGGSFLETEEGYLKVDIDKNFNVRWKYIDYGWTKQQ